MRWIGLTGGIATGKSATSEIIRKSGIPVVDADVVAREVVARGTLGIKKIVDVFGNSFVSNGELDRSRLGRLVFEDPFKRQQLEKIVHPLIQARVAEVRKKLESEKHPMVFYDVPLLYEKNLQGQFEAIVVVACSAQKQLERLMQRNKLSRAQAAERIGTQIPIADKAAQADYVIWNDGVMKDLVFAVKKTLDLLKAARPA